MHIVGLEVAQVTMLLPRELDDSIDYLFPAALWVAAEKHSDEAYTVWVLDVDYAYNEIRACLSLDGRWTLSPIRGPWHTAETGVPQRKARSRWRKRRRKARRK
jgi:hypothetical protein